MPADGHYPHVRLHGRYRLQHDYVLDDQVRDGQQGVIVFSPFTPDDGALGLLVNRGFIARASRPGCRSFPLRRLVKSN